MNTFKVGDQFHWQGNVDWTMTVAEVSGMFIITEHGSAYLYVDCVKVIKNGY